MKQFLVSGILATLFKGATACIPMVDCSTGYEGTIERSNIGWHIIWVYPGPGNNPVVKGFSCAHGVCDPGKFVTDYSFVQSQTDKKAAALEKIPTTVLDCTTYAELCAERKVIVDGLKVKAAARWPVAPRFTYFVAINPRAIDDPPTRPAYALTNGIVGTKIIGRALVGVPCDLTKGIAVTATGTMATFGPEFKEGIVALCKESGD